MQVALLQGLVELLTGSLWTYPLLFGICAGDALIPAFPSDGLDRVRYPGGAG